MGGDQPSTPEPPPSTGETSAEAIQAQIDALPKMLEAQKEYGPQFSEVELKSLKEFGPQFAEEALKLQQEYGPQFAEVERSLSPELAGAQDTLANFFKQTDQGEYESLKPGILEDVRAGHSARGIGDISPLGSIDESVQLQRLKQSLKERRLNVALSTAGRVPISGVPQLQGQTGTGQLVQNVNPDSIFNYQSSLNNFNSSIFGTQSAAATARRGQNVSMANAAIGQVGSLAETGAGAAFLMCWVASEIFEGWHESKTQNARLYINTLAPKWFKKLYRKHGFKFAKFISDKPIIKNILRPFFEVLSDVGKRMLVTYELT